MAIIDAPFDWFLDVLYYLFASIISWTHENRREPDLNHVTNEAALTSGW